MNLITEALIFAVGFNLLLFIPAYLLQSDKLTDLSYALTFTVLAIFGYNQSTRESIDTVLLTLVLIWAIRLGGFLFIRILKEGKDSRFDEMRKSWFSFIRFWFFQGLTVFIVLLPGLLFWRQHKESNHLLIAGVVIWTFGLLIEATADYQKYRFKRKGYKNWIDEGVWRASRHPNYLGEILVWVGFYITAFSGLSGLDWLFASASPVYITFILLRFSGVPLLEKSADKKWGSDKSYQEYKKKVPVLIPAPSSLKRLLK